MTGRHVWSKAELAFLAENYPTVETAAIAAHFGLPLHKVYARAKKSGLSKTGEYLREHARFSIPPAGSVRFRYPKGHEPANKGTRRPGYAPGRMAETQFKKGQRTNTWKPVGTILPDAEGYLRIKVRERRPDDAPGWNTDVWPLLSHHVWRQHHGPIPPKHCVVFKDRDRSNCAIENLELITLAENAHRNRMWGRLPRELAEVINLNGQLKRKIRRRENAKEPDKRSAQPSV